MRMVIKYNIIKSGIISYGSDTISNKMYRNQRISILYKILRLFQNSIIDFNDIHENSSSYFKELGQLISLPKNPKK